MNVWYCCRYLSYLLCPLLYICNLHHNVTQIVLSLLVSLFANLMQVSFWNYKQSDMMIRMITFTTYQHCHIFFCSSNRSQILFHVILPSIYSNHSNIEKWHVPKNSLSLAKVGSSAMFGVEVFKASIFNSLGGPNSQSRFICHVWCSGIQDIYFQFPWGIHWPKKVHLPIFVYWYSRHLCSITGGSICQSYYYTKQQQHEIISTVNCFCCLCVILTINNNNMKS